VWAAAGDPTAGFIGEDGVVGVAAGAYVAVVQEFVVA
jgi:hypothetical protein